MHPLATMRTSYKLLLAFLVLTASLALMRVNGWFALGFAAALPLAILWWIDLGRELRALGPDDRLYRLVSLFIGVPQAMSGLTCMIAGISIFVWAFYNSFWKPDPHYVAGFQVLGCGGLLVLSGIALQVGAFRKSPQPSPDVLVACLLDKTTEIGDRDHAARDLGEYDLREVEQALLTVVLDLTEQDMIADSAADSLREIWTRQKREPAHETVTKMHPSARKFFVSSSK